MKRRNCLLSLLYFLRSSLPAQPPRLRLAQDRGDDCALLHFLARSGVPIPGCVARHFLRRQSYAQLAWIVNRVQSSRWFKFAGSRDQDRPIAMGDRTAGKKRTVLAKPKLREDCHADVRSRRSWVSVRIGVGRWS